jgi:hypothetical protein
VLAQQIGTKGGSTCAIDDPVTVCAPLPSTMPEGGEITHGADELPPSNLGTKEQCVTRVS